MSSPVYSLHQLGWRASYAQHLALDDFESAYPARVMAVHRSGLAVLSSRGHAHVVVPQRVVDALEVSIAVGDWVLVEDANERVARLVERQSLIERIGAGTDGHRQSIAANVDTLFVVSSCNEDFNPSRLERYLALAHQAGVEPVVVLTKADLCSQAGAYVAQAHGVARGAAVVAVDATKPEGLGSLARWLAEGNTVAFVGSSGVGKSTLTNALVGNPAQLTSAIRDDDARGRHTTTGREMFLTCTGAWVIDTPGMRELRVGAAVEGVQTTFDDVQSLALACRFRDCSHGGEAGCAVRAALDEGRLELRRWTSYQKLQREVAEASRTIRERHENNRQFGCMARSAMRAKRERQGR